MTKEEVLQKANDYCTEKSYTNETLTDAFKDKFSEYFAKKYPDTKTDDELATADLKFNLDTAFSATSKCVAAKQKAFDALEDDYKRQISELTKKSIADTGEPKRVSLPEDVKQQLEELKSFRVEAQKAKKREEILTIAKSKVRQDLHRSLERYASDLRVTLEEGSNEQAKKLTERFQEIFKDSIGDIKPFAPKQTQKRLSDFLDSITKVEI